MILLEYRETITDEWLLIWKVIHYVAEEQQTEMAEMNALYLYYSAST